MHTILSDGGMIASEVARRAENLDHALIAITDHVDKSNIDICLSGLLDALADINSLSEISVLAGVEITHVPPATIDEIARQAKYKGANIVVVHGETVAEPVQPGTNAAAVNSPYVDILAHPGLISPEVAQTARENEVYIELTAKAGHDKTNPHVAKVCRECGAKMVVNTDLHSPDDFISQTEALEIALAAGLDRKQAIQTVRENPIELSSRAALHFRR